MAGHAARDEVAGVAARRARTSWPSRRRSRWSRAAIRSRRSAAAPRRSSPACTSRPASPVPPVADAAPVVGGHGIVGRRRAGDEPRDRRHAAERRVGPDRPEQQPRLRVDLRVARAEVAARACRPQQAARAESTCPARRSAGTRRPPAAAEHSTSRSRRRSCRCPAGRSPPAENPLTPATVVVCQPLVPKPANGTPSPVSGPRSAGTASRCTRRTAKSSPPLNAVALWMNSVLGVERGVGQAIAVERRVERPVGEVELQDLDVAVPE